jgi:ADP-ribose pyrophosphatase YjhB (NUDIX family)
VGHFCVNCGAPLAVKTIEGRELEVCPNDSYVLWHDPKVAAAVVVEHEGGVVLGRRSIEPGYGLWCLPGGFVNDDEDPAAAAVRECMEEINAEVELTGLLGVYHIPKTTASSIIGIAYRGRLVDGAAISAGPEMLEVRVFAPGALPEIAFPSHQAVLETYVTSPGRGAEAAPLIGGASVLTLAPPSQGQEPPTPQRTR